MDGERGSALDYLLRRKARRRRAVRRDVEAHLIVEIADQVAAADESPTGAVARNRRT